MTTQQIIRLLRKEIDTRKEELGRMFAAYAILTGCRSSGPSKYRGGQMKHRHHKIPRHAGGTDDPDNLELLTIPEHAEAHRKLYEEFGRWQDKIAWKSLLGLINKDNVREAAYRKGLKKYLQSEKFQETKKKAAEGLRRAYKNGHSPWNKGKSDCENISENTKRQAATGNFHNIGDYQRGRTFDDDHKKKLREKAAKRSKSVCSHCEREFSPAMFARWHGEKCSANKTRRR